MDSHLHTSSSSLSKSFHRFYFLLLGSLLVLAQLFAIPSYAFKTYKLFGGNIHEQISAEALTKGGFHFGKAALAEVDRGNTEQDDPFKPFILQPNHHFDDCTLDATNAYIDKCHKSISSLAAKAVTDRKSRKKILHLFGNLLHPAQDFYSHSNYLELQLKANPKFSFADIPLVDWADVSNSGISSTKPSVRTGFFYYKSKLLNELTMPRNKAVEAFAGDPRVPSGTSFLPNRQYKQLSTTDQRLDFACDPKTVFLHRDINKDNDSSDEGGIRAPLHDGTLFDYAKQLAVRETRAQWKNVEAEIRSAAPSNADELINRLKRGD